MSDEKFRVVYHATSLLEAENVKGILEASGITARVPGELSTGPVVTGQETQGNVTVEVPADRAHEARTVISSARGEGEKLEGWLAEHPDESDAPGT